MADDETPGGQRISSAGPRNPERLVEDVVSYLAGSRTSFDEFWQSCCKWPPDTFAVTSLLLEESGAYHLLVSPKSPFPARGWVGQIEKAGEEWRSFADAADGSRPGWFDESLSALRGIYQTPIGELREPADDVWPAIQHLFRLHAAADEACKGLGRPGSDNRTQAFEVDANTRLTKSGSLSKFPTDRIKVLPKLHTPQVGITLRSLSRYVAVQRSPVKINWHLAQRLGDKSDRRLNLLLVPWPFEMDSSAFAVDSSESHPDLTEERFGFFRFAPQLAFGSELLAELVGKARQEVGRLHGVVFPESALSEDEARKAANWLFDNDVELLLAGVRDEGRNLARLAVRRMGTTLQGDDSTPLYSKYDQYKHHRWCLEERQIGQYGLQWKLNPHRRWWENVRIDPRTLNFVSSWDWLCICHLICEDLARLEPVTSSIRAIGPNLVVALLQDGPQLEQRWPGRYASVLADDPGSSVLTLTSLGMCEMSPKDGKVSRAIGLWKDAVQGTTVLELPSDSDALLITLTAKYTTEWTADGRSDHGRAAHLVLTGTRPLTRSST